VGIINQTTTVPLNLVQVTPTAPQTSGSDHASALPRVASMYSAADNPSYFPFATPIQEDNGNVCRQDEICRCYSALYDLSAVRDYFSVIR
jgi:hypothetical protein